MPVSPPLSRSKTCASFIRLRLATLNALPVQVRQPALAVVGPFQLAIGTLVMQPPELVSVVIGVRVERLAPAELVDDLLDLAVVGALLLAVGQGQGGPEAEVHVGGLRIERVERPAPPVARAQRADPERLDRNLAHEEVEELAGARDGHLDVLHHVLLRGPAAQPVQPPHRAVAPLQLHQLPVVGRAQPALRHEPPDAWILDAESPRTPEPVGVPAPEIVAHAEMVDLELL